MKTKIAILILGILLCCGEFASAYDYVYFDDGQNHIIADATYQYDYVYLDGYIANNPGTHLQIVDGATVNYIALSNYSTLEVDGGLIGTGIHARNNSQIAINGGTVGTIWSDDQSSFDINGGIINGWISTSGNITGNIAGGIFAASSYFMTSGNSKIFLYGDNFSVDGIELNYGDNLRAYGVVGGPNFAFLTGTITGTLSDGSLLNCEFLIRPDGEEGGIIIIPEPATCSLLLTAGVFLFRRSR